MIQVYIKTNNEGYIEEVPSNIFLQEFTDWIQIDEGDGDKYAHAQSNYLSKPLYNSDNTHNYIFENSNIRETTDQEKEEERKNQSSNEVQSSEDFESMYLLDLDYRITLLENGIKESDLV